MIVKLAVPCPDCGEDTYNQVYIGPDDDGELVIPILGFEQEHWTCEDCDITFATGELEVWKG